jgi:signal transduction histidine kinase
MSMTKEPQTDGMGSYYPWLCLLVALVTAVAGLGLPLYVLGWSREHGMTIGQYVDLLHSSTELTRAVTSAQFKTALLISVSAAIPMGFETLVDCAYTMVYEEERLLWYSKTLLLLAMTIPNLVLLFGDFGTFSDDAYLLATACARVSIAGFTMAYASQIFHKYHMKDLSIQCLQVATLGSASYLIRSYSNFASPTYLASLVYFSTALRLVAHALFVDIIRRWYLRAHSSQEALSYCEIVIVFKVVATFIANSLFSLVAQYFNASNDRDASSDCICMYMYIQIIYTMFVMSIPGRISRLEVGFLSRDMKERQAFIRYISHEIRTPLNTVFLGLEYVTSALKEIPSRKWDTSVEPVIDTVNDIYCSCEIALSILNDLLTFDKMEGGKMTLDLELVNCHSFMTALLKPFNVNARNKNIHFQLRNSNLSMDFIRNAHINIDECKMGQVVRNLISNALKFTPNGGAVTVTMLHVQANNPLNSHNQSDSDSLPSLWPFINNLTAASKLPPLRDMLRVEVQDTGAGISHFNQTKLFGQYVQFNANKLQKGSGSGLGLWISKGITELHGGNIGGHSDGEERGSMFFIELPVTFLIDDDEELAASNSGGCSVSTPSTPSIDHIRRTRCDAKRMQQYTNDFKGLMPQNEIGSSMSRMTAESLTEGAMSHIKRAGDRDLTAPYSSATPGLSKISLRVPSGGDSTLESGFPYLPNKVDKWRGSSDTQSVAEDEGGFNEKGETDDLLGEARKIQNLRREISLISGASSVSSRSSQKTENASASGSLFGLSEMLTRSIRGGISESSMSRKDSPDFLSSAHPFMVTSMPNIHSVSSSRNSSSKFHSRFTSMSNSPRLGNSGSSTPVTISTGLSTPYLHSPHSSPRGSGTYTSTLLSSTFSHSTSIHHKALPSSPLRHTTSHH